MRKAPDRAHAEIVSAGDADEPIESEPFRERSLLATRASHVDQRWLRQMNRAVVLACVRDYGPIARVTIAERTALSRATVSAITQALLEEGVLREGERLPSTARGGRRAVLLYDAAEKS